MNGGFWKVPSTEWVAFMRGIAGALAVDIPFYLTERGHRYLCTKADLANHTAFVSLPKETEHLL